VLMRVFLRKSGLLSFKGKVIFYAINYMISF